MEFNQLKTTRGELIQGPLLLKPSIFGDSRGSFFESWNSKKFNQIINKKVEFHQDNHSISEKGVLRGLHYQLNPEPQGKLVRCVKGKIFDVAVDIRNGSKSFGEWVSCYLSSENKNQLWIPVGFAHGFLTISDSAEVLYKASGYWNKECERSIIWDDSRINIIWPLSSINRKLPSLSDKDSVAPSLDDLVRVGETL